MLVWSSVCLLGSRVLYPSVCIAISVIFVSISKVSFTLAVFTIPSHLLSCVFLLPLTRLSSVFLPTMPPSPLSHPVKPVIHSFESIVEGRGKEGMEEEGCKMDEERKAGIREGKTDRKAPEDRREDGEGKVMDEAKMLMMCEQG